MTLRPPVAVDRALEEAQPQARAKPLPRAVEPVIESALGAAVADSGMSVRAVANFVGVDESIMRDIIAGRRPIGEARIRALPTSVRTAYLARLADEPPPSGLTLPQLAMRDGELHGLGCAETRAALLDGIVDAEELRRIRRAVHAGVLHRQQWIADIDRELAKRCGR